MAVAICLSITPLAAQDSIRSYRVMRPAETDSTVSYHTRVVTPPPVHDTVRVTDSLYCSATGCPPGAWSTTKPAPPPPPPPPPTGCTGVAIAVGTNWQSKVDANPAGTTFCIATGTHLNQSVMSKSRNQYLGTTGAVMDGNNTATVAFRSANGNPDSVTIKKLKITRYNPGYASSVVQGRTGDAAVTTGWTLEDVEVSYSETGTGVATGHRLVCRRCNLHHNDVQNISGSGDDILIEDSELAYGNYRQRNEWGNSGGGSKWVLTNRLTVRNTYAHHNHGPGLWTDIDNVNTLYENNRVEDNLAAGIFHEIGWAAVIRNNIVKRNGFGWTGSVWGAGIQIAASRDVEVYGNTVEGNRMGIIGVQQDRGSGTFGVHDIKNLYVHDNTVTLDAGEQTGAAHLGGADMSSWNIRFTGNDYTVQTANQAAFSWANAARAWAQWRGYGFDLTGTLTVIP